MDKEQLRLYLSEQYTDYKSFLENIIFPIFGEEDFEDDFGAELLKLEPERRPLAEATGIKSIKSIGSILVGIEPLQIFDITVSDRVRMERNRVSIQRLIRSVMDIYSSSFMIFHYDDDEHWDWRFTYCHKGKNNEEYTDSKRYTFLLGPRQSCRTATDNFMSLYEKRGNIDFKDIEQAFSVEALSKEFFGKYKYFYEKFVKYMTTDETIRATFLDTDFDHTNMSEEQIHEREEKPMRDYAKKLLGRIVFLHFLQKKGWLGVKAGEEWGTGPRDFMLRLFTQATDEQKADFLDGILEPLYDKGLDTKRTDDLFDTKVEGFTNVRIPYLNGGLFERDTLDKKICKLPAEYFAELLDKLSQYNFTIDENDPNDAEVGVDPEMLGRIFENLLEDNKDKGAYYTPKEIVQYMCRESLIAYLQTDLKEEDKEKVRTFVQEHDAEPLGELKEEIVNKLIEVKICDPAIGSGAFPMGLLRELYFCHSAIDPNVINYPSETKRYIIQNNIYGVDIDRGAVDIAQLRFWLALVVDEKEPAPLPNLDFKIMQGNSLLEQYDDVDLSKLTYIKKDIDHNTGLQTTIYDNELNALRLSLLHKMEEYYTCDEHSRRLQLREEITSIVKKQIEADYKQVNLDGIDIYANSKFFLWHTWFADVFSRPQKDGCKTKDGYDIVIGNPPYVSAPNQVASPILSEQRQRIVESGKYESLYEKWDLYIPFMERGLQLLCSDGIFSMIVPYPLSNQKYAKKMRKMLTEDYSILEIVDLNGTKIFENATISNCIPFVRNIRPQGDLRITHINDNKFITEAFRKSQKNLTQDYKTYVWNLVEDKQTGNLYSNMHTLADICYISVGLVINADEKENKGAFKKKDLISDTYDSIHCRKYIEAKDIDKYHVKRVRYLEWNTTRCPDRLRRPTFRELYDCPKLLINSIGTINATIDTEKHFLHNHSITCAVLWKDLKNVNNKSISTSIRKFCKLERKEMEQLSNGFDLHYILGVINSSVVSRILADMRGGALNIYPEHIRHIPIPIPSDDVQATIGDIAKDIIARKAQGEDCQYLELQLDELVEQLYKQ